MKHLLQYFGVIALVITVMGCQNDPYPTNTKDIEKHIADHFGFQSRMDCPVTIASDGKRYVEVFDTDPRLNPDATPIYAIFTDADGIQNGTMCLPSTMEGQTLYASKDIYPSLKAIIYIWNIRNTQPGRHPKAGTIKTGICQGNGEVCTNNAIDLIS